MAKMNQPGTDRGERGETGEKSPKGSGSSDHSGERKARLVGGVAMDQDDATGSDGQFNTGRCEGVCYSHKRHPHSQE